jgi:dolichol-phosphate mannosyltransferase
MTVHIESENPSPVIWEVPDHRVTEFKGREARYCIGIPVLNENGRFTAQIKRMHALGLNGLADIVIADGNSTDGSTDPSFLSAHGIRALLIKLGPGRLSAQIRMVLAYALKEGYDGIVLVDGNNKDGVEAIPDFLKALENGWDYVQGSRYIPGGYEENTPLSRKVGVKLIHAPVLSIAAGVRYTDTTNGFRGLSRRFLLDPRLQPFRDVFSTYNLHYYLALMAPRLGYQVKELPVTRRYPATGELPSKIKGWKANLHILELLFKTVLGCYRPRDIEAPDRRK